MSMRKAALAVLFAVVLLAISLYILFPFYWLIVNSLKSPSELFFSPVRYWPQKPSLDNYRKVLASATFVRAIVNSLAVAGGATLAALALGSLAAYALGRYRFRGRSAILYAILAMSTFPQIAVLGGLFMMVKALGLYNTPGALVFSYTIFTLPFTVWVLATFVRQIPEALPEAAHVDGASPLQILWRIMLPVMAPAMVTTGLLAFINAWNEFLFALTLTIDRQARTVPVAIALFTGASEHELPWGQITAASVVVCVPVVLLGLFFQRRIVEGLVAGSVKG
jgi:trehalose/maltose transport system permease protein